MKLNLLLKWPHESLATVSLHTGDHDADEDDWNEFNDINKIVIRHQIRTEYKVQFPDLYTSRPRAVALAPYHHPPLYYVKPDDPDLPAFYFDPVRRRRLTRPWLVLFSIPSLAVARRAPKRPKREEKTTLHHRRSSTPSRPSAARP